MADYTNSISRPSLRWLVLGSSTYRFVRLAASILAALISSLIWNWNDSQCPPQMFDLVEPEHRAILATVEMFNRAVTAFADTAAHLAFQ